MKIIVNYHTILREITRKHRDEIDVDESSTIEDILNLLSKNYGKKFKRYMLSGIKHKGLPLIFLLNGENIEKLNGFETKLHDRDNLAIIPPVAGG